MLFTFLLVVQAIIAFALVTVILMQRSEGGGLGMGGGGSPSGLMSARGAADFLSRATKILATLFVGMSIVLAVIAATQHRAATIDTSLVGQSGTSDMSAPIADGDGISAAANSAAAPAGPASAPANGAAGAPLAQ
ncbi:preprotein translocase subunit SecG [Sphingobium sp. B11D3B]|nr:preprotein translocase subunit SecG [Sphingobium sp. B11D3B]